MDTVWFPLSLKGKVSVSCTGINSIKREICLDDVHFLLTKPFLSEQGSDRIWHHSYSTVRGRKKTTFACCSFKLTHFHPFLDKCWPNCLFPVLLLWVTSPWGTPSFSSIAWDAEWWLHGWSSSHMAHPWGKTKQNHNFLAGLFELCVMVMCALTGWGCSFNLYVALPDPISISWWGLVQIL